MSPLPPDTVMTDWDTKTYTAISPVTMGRSHGGTEDGRELWPCFSSDFCLVREQISLSA